MPLSCNGSSREVTPIHSGRGGAALGETRHRVILGDARRMSLVEDQSVHLVVTSPPYWTLQAYPSRDGQLGQVHDYVEFLDGLDKVWRECHRVLVPGGRMCVVVGDVNLSRRRFGRHQVIPLHADLVVRCRAMGFDYLAPIFWHKIANLRTEMKRPGSWFLGKPFEPNGIIKNDVEYILLFRKGGEYRHPTPEQREASRLPKELYFRWFRQIWDDVSGQVRSSHPAPFPEEIPLRLIHMFSFVGDVVLDPFLGTGTTTVAAMKAGRSSAGYEIEPAYIDVVKRRLAQVNLWRQSTLEIVVDRQSLDYAVTPRPLAPSTSLQERQNRLVAVDVP